MRFALLTMRSTRLVLITIGVLASLLAFAVLFDIRSDRQLILVVTADTPVFRDLPAGLNESVAVNPVVAVIPRGRSYHVLRVRYGKDFRAARIRLADGATGWVLTDSSAHLERSQ